MCYPLSDLCYAILSLLYAILSLLCYPLSAICYCILSPLARHGRCEVWKKNVSAFLWIPTKYQKGAKTKNLQSRGSEPEHRNLNPSLSFAAQRDSKRCGISTPASRTHQDFQGSFSTELFSHFRDSIAFNTLR